MTTTPRFTSADLDAFPDDGKRYEIIDGELYVSTQPHVYHQFVCSEVWSKLQQWSAQSRAGRAVIAPGVIFADDDDVAPDVVWLSSPRMASVLGQDGKLHGPPELMIEVLSPGAANEKLGAGRIHSAGPIRSRWARDTWSKFRAHTTGMPSSDDRTTSVVNARIVRVTGTTMISFK